MTKRYVAKTRNRRSNKLLWVELNNKSINIVKKFIRKYKVELREDKLNNKSINIVKKFIRKYKVEFREDKLMGEKFNDYGVAQKRYYVYARVTTFNKTRRRIERI